MKETGGSKGVKDPFRDDGKEKMPVRADDSLSEDVSAKKRRRPRRRKKKTEMEGLKDDVKKNEIKSQTFPEKRKINAFTDDEVEKSAGFDDKTDDSESKPFINDSSVKDSAEDSGVGTSFEEENVSPVEGDFPAFGADSPVEEKTSSPVEGDLPSVEEKTSPVDGGDFPAFDGASVEENMPPVEGDLPSVEDSLPRASDEFSNLGSPGSPSVDPVYSDVPSPEEEQLKQAEDDEQEKQEEASKDFSKDSFKEDNSPFFAPTESVDKPSDFALPTSPTPIDDKAFENKPLDEVSFPQEVPFSSPNSPEQAPFEDKVEDMETDEVVNPFGESSMNDPNEPAHKEISFDETPVPTEGVIDDPLTSRPDEDMRESGFDAGLGQNFGVEVEVADVTSPAGGVSDLDQNEDGFWGILENAGISKRHVFMLLGFFGAIVFVVLFFVFGGHKLFIGIGDLFTKDEVETPVVEVETPVAEEQKTLPKTDGASQEKQKTTDYDQTFALSGVVNSYIFGLEFSKQMVLPGLNLDPVSAGGSMVGVDVSLDFGRGRGVDNEAIVYYSDLLRRIDNAVKVDVYEYLNKYVDRRAALQEHLVGLNILFMEADSSKNTVIQELNRLDAEYKASSDEKDAYESAFFEAIEGFNGQSTYDYLQLFTEASQKRVKQKADYNALRVISLSLDSAISVLSPRIRDISVNADALIKGVRVFEVKGSNIDAIILQ